MNIASSSVSDRVLTDFGRFMRTTPVKVLVGVALLSLALLMGATQGHSGTPKATQYSVVDVF